MICPTYQEMTGVIHPASYDILKITMKNKKMSIMMF